MVFVALILFFQTVCVISTRPLQFFTITVPASFFLIALLKNIHFRKSLWFGLLVLGFFFPLLSEQSVSRNGTTAILMHILKYCPVSPC